MHTNSVIEAEQDWVTLLSAQMLNPTDTIDRRMLDPNEAAALLSCNGNSETFASRSRNQDFHALFPDISPAELLCDDFSCGNYYILCFSMAERSSIAGAIVSNSTKCILLFKNTLGLQGSI